MLENAPENLIRLADFQLKALQRMKNGCILNGGVGSGKSRTALAYYYKLYGGILNTPSYIKMRNPSDLYIITTAMKRDSLDWEKEMIPFHLTTDKEDHYQLNIYKNKVVIDSWNNIKKYVNVHNAFFIFDEQRVVGKGAWVRSFLTICKKNQNKWILLTATPGDTWSDYLPVFLANNFFRTKQDFYKNHAIFNPYVPFPQITKYYNEGYLIKCKKEILIPIEFKRQTTRHIEYITCSHNRNEYENIVKTRWNPYQNEPIKSASEYCYLLRKTVNKDPSRLVKCLELIEKHKRIIIFYSFDYELFLLRDALKDYNVHEWNGHNHDLLPNDDEWVYLVQYTAGNEGWNCITANAMILFSQTYSYKVFEQVCGRIDRMDNIYFHLYYYIFISDSKIDKAIFTAIQKKKKFNVLGFAPNFPKQPEIQSSYA